MLSSPNMEWVRKARFYAPDRLIHLFVGGSELHGAKVGTTDDLDLYGLYMEAPEEALGLQSKPHFVWSTAENSRRNGPGDVDLTLYSLRRWATLAAKGNATALHFLFADATAVSEPSWLEVQESRRLFFSKRSAIQFLGFAGNQLRRIVGEAGRGTHGRRPEYECVHGYDSKAAMHCLRLYFECIELMNHGCITLPRPEREMLIEVRQGRWSESRLRAEAAALLAEAEAATRSSGLPETVDERAISRLIARVHLSYWGLRSLHR